MGIKVVRDIKDLDNFEETLRGMSHETCNNDGKNGLTVSFFYKLCNQARVALEGSPPPFTDH
eukprot:1603092-Ditylum_brightwellii.AAC.1